MQRLTRGEENFLIYIAILEDTTILDDDSNTETINIKISIKEKVLIMEFMKSKVAQLLSII